jgi:hypothetical protein
VGGGRGRAHEAVHGGGGLIVDGAALLLAVLDGVVDQVLVRGLARSREDQRRVRRRILCVASVSTATCVIAAVHTWGL